MATTDAIATSWFPQLTKNCQLLRKLDKKTHVHWKEEFFPHLSSASRNKS